MKPDATISKDKIPEPLFDHTLIQKDLLYVEDKTRTQTLC